MKKLKLESPLKNKLDRLEMKIGVLHYLGTDPNVLLKQPTVAIVGTRKLSPYGKQVTGMLASELARAGVVIVSGNALGLDVTAEKSALDAGGKVIAVVASGLDNVYPATNSQVANEIVKQGGAILSEYEEGHIPRPHEFLDRNRIIAALSDIVIIPEATERSGSLNTSRHAKSMNIPIFAVPGPITSSLSGGTNQLIKDGARVVTKTSDILEFLGIDKKSAQKSLKGSNDTETAILQAISEGVQDITLIQHSLNIPVNDLQTALTMLEINGAIFQNSLGMWNLK